ncbi:MAG: hypothetical protein ACE14W_07675 [Candidatus Velamenicoccus archaeovorus]
MDRVRRELIARLDPWSYWVVDPAAEVGGDLAVVGTTGGFLLAVCGLDGYLEAGGDRLSVDGAPVLGFREVKAGAKRVRSMLAGRAVFTEVVPMICLSRAKAGTSRTVRGVRVVRLEDLASEVAGREKTLSANRAQRGAEAVGTVVASGQGALPDVEEPEA